MEIEHGLSMDVELAVTCRALSPSNPGKQREYVLGLSIFRVNTLTHTDSTQQLQAASIHLLKQAGALAVEFSRALWIRQHVKLFRKADLQCQCL